MLQCKNCGSQNADNLIFCERCGAKLPFEEIHMPRPDMLDVVNPVIQVGRSQKFFVMIILYGLAILLSIIASAVSSGSMVNQMKDILEQSGLIDSDLLSSIMDGMNGLLLGSALVGNVPGILICISLFLFHTACKRNDIRSRSLNIIKIMCIIVLSLLGLAVLIFTVVLIGFDTTAAIVFLILCGAIAILPVLYYIKAIGAINNIHTTLKTGEPKRLSQYIIAINWIMIVLNGLGVLGSLFAFNLLSILSGGLIVAFMVILTTEMSNYNKNFTY